MKAKVPSLAHARRKLACDCTAEIICDKAKKAIFLYNHLNSREEYVRAKAILAKFEAEIQLIVRTVFLDGMGAKLAKANLK